MLPLDSLLALILFGFVSSITPGPNNLMLLASGVNFGIRRTIPHMLGIGVGFALMVVLVGLGFGQVFARYPDLHVALKIVGTLYMVYLAWRLANGGGIGDSQRPKQPMAFLQAAAFQWVNPKAWAMAVSAIAAYTVPDHYTLSILTIAVVFGAVNLPSVSCWALFGLALRRVLSNVRIIRIFNVSMALLLIASLFPVASELWLFLRGSAV